MDTRRDAGEFYPGGKVISTRPLASGGDVKHREFEDLDVKTNTIPDLRQAVRELGRRLGATVVTALAACVATAATVHIVPVNDLDFDANPSLVTNVTFEGLAQEGELESIRVEIASNRVAIASNTDAISTLNDSISTVSNAAVHAAITNALQDAALAGKASVADATLTPIYSDTPTFSEWVCEPDTVTVYWNDDRGMWNTSPDESTPLSDEAYNPDATNIEFYLEDGGGRVTATRVRTDIIGYTLGSQTDKPLASEAEAAANRAAISTLSDSISTLNDTKLDKSGGTMTGILSVPELDIVSGSEIVGIFPKYMYIPGVGFIDFPSTSGTLALTSDIPTVPTNVSAFNNDAGYLTSYTETDPTISAWAKAASKPTYTADEVGAVSSNKIEEVRTDNAQTRQIVTTWENFLDGSNVVFSITNYLSGSYNLDAAKLRILELREGEYHEVFNSRDEILLHIENFRTNDFRAATNQLVGAVNEAIGGKADRDWGKYTSAGGDAPANTVYMTAPNTVFAGGLEYERVAVGEGTICVLTTRGAPVWTQGDEGTFKFQDDGGTNYFGFAKTDSYTIGANTDGITVQGGMVTMNYNITMSGRPCVWYKSSLSSGAWEQLNLPDGSPVAGASHAVTWEENPDPGTQVCYINVGNAPSGFFRATVEVTGEAKFMTNMPADMSGGIVCPNTATGVSGVIKPTFDGTSVIWTWSAK